eukprot:g3264.t1
MGPLLVADAWSVFGAREALDYETGGSTMFQGFGPVFVTAAGVFRMLVMPFFGLVCIAAWEEDTKKVVVPRWSVKQPVTTEDIE